MKKIILSLLFCAALVGSASAGFYRHIPTYEWSGSTNSIGPDADSVRWEAYYPANAGTPIITDTMTMGVEGRWTNGSHTTDTAGVWCYRYIGFYGTDSVKAEEKPTVSDTLHANPADYQGSSLGSGLQVDSIFVYDSSGTDAPVSGVSVTIQNAGQTANEAYGINTNSSGYVTYNLDASTTYKGVAKAPGYTFPVATFTSSSGATSNDTIWGYNVVIGAPADADLKRIFGWIKDLSDNPLVGAIVSLTLDVPGDTIPRMTGTDVTIYRTAVLDTTDVDGYWYLDIYPTDVITPASCTYQYRATYNSEYIRWHKKTFSPTGTTAQSIT